MSKKNKIFYYIFNEKTHITTLIGVPALAKFLDRPIQSVYTSMSLCRRNKKKYYVLKDYEGNKYIVYDEIQFFGKGNLK